MGSLFTVITGLDGSGTSTVARALHEADPGSLLIQSPPEPFGSMRRQVDGSLREFCPEAHYLFYLASNVYTSRLVTEGLNAGRRVYCVRYLIDTVVSHRVQGILADLTYDGGLYRVRPPDLTVFLEIDEEVRQRRITARPGGKSPLDRVLDDDATRKRYLAEFFQVCPNLVVVDNGNRPLSEVVAEIQRHCLGTAEVV